MPPEAHRQCTARLARGLILLVLLVISLPLGTLCHELIGHGMVGVLVGGTISGVEILGVRLWPTVGWNGWSGYYGIIGVEGVTTDFGDAVMSLGGSMSTWLVSVLACAALWVRRWGAAPRTVLVVLSLWWIDLLTYTLPSWGIRRSILWGGFYSEPYEAAVSLGIPGPAFQAFVLASCALLAAAAALALPTTHPV